MRPPLQRRAAARARSKCGRSAWPGDKALRLQWRAAPTCTAHAALARKRCPARSCMIMSESPLPTLSPSAGARSAPCDKRLDQREAHDVFDIPTTKRQRAHVYGGGTTCRRPGAQRPRHRRRARSARRRQLACRGAASTGSTRCGRWVLGGFCLLAQLLQLTSWCGLRLCHQHLAVGPL